MKALDEDTRAVDDNDDLDEGLTPGAIPAGEEIQEGDEEHNRDADLPPAMPPGA